MNDPSESAWREAFELAREAQEAGLVVVQIAPHRCGGGTEYAVSLWQPDGGLWADGRHKLASTIREQHIAGWRTRAARREERCSAGSIAELCCLPGAEGRLHVLGEIGYRCHGEPLDEAVITVAAQCGFDPHALDRHVAVIHGFEPHDAGYRRAVVEAAECLAAGGEGCTCQGDVTVHLLDDGGPES